MEILNYFIEVVIHLDGHLAEFIAHYGSWIYAILFVIIFCETGLIVTPFLPGDSLLFAAGSLAAIGELNVHSLFILLTIAAIVGDTVNYTAGRFLGEGLFKSNARLLKTGYLERTHRFYERHGGKTILLARFVPLLRTFAPFVAGAGTMQYDRFLTYNVVGGAAWTASFIYGGYYFGNLPFVKQNFTLVVLVIIILSIMPGIFEYFRYRAKLT